MLLYALVFGIFGAIIGSFLNVLILRYGVKTISGRSACASCGHELEVVDLVPIFSWIFLGGRCRFCGSWISPQYPLVEGITAILFGFIGAAPLSPPLQLLALPILALLVVLSVYDIRHTILPDPWIIAFALFSLLFTLAHLTSVGELSTFTWFFLAGPASALPFWALWFISGGRWMGLGDSKLAWGIGWLLGPMYSLVAIAFAFIIGALVSVVILLPLSSPRFRAFAARVTHTKRSGSTQWGFTIKSEVAFGPFLAAACALVWLMLLFGHDPLAYLTLGSL